MISKTKLELPKNYRHYSTSSLAFFLYPGYGNGVYTCREVFSGSFVRSTYRIGILANKLDINKLNNFFKIIHKGLKLKKENEVIFNPTPNSDVVIVTVPDFWRENITRRQVFTLLLRVATYFKDDVEQAIIDYSLSKRCKDALLHYINGNVSSNYKEGDWTNANGGFGNGFVTKFENAPLNFITKNLSFPGKKSLTSFINFVKFSL